MKKKYIALLLSAALSLSMLNGCGGADQGMKTKMNISRHKENGEAVYGEVSKITENAITIQLGTRKEMERPDGEGKGKSEGNPPQQRSGEISEKPSGERPEGSWGEMPEGEKGQLPEENQRPEGQPPEMPSMLELTGEEKEIVLTDSTLIKRQTRGSSTDGEEAEGEIAITDLSEGDMVEVLLAEDGNAKEIIVLSGEPGEKPSQFA